MKVAHLLAASPLRAVSQVLVPARVAVAVGVYVYFLLLVAKGSHAGWGDFKVPALPPLFADMRSLTTAWDCVRDGIDPLANNPCDPYERPANYPRLWLWLSWFGLGESSSLALGLVAAALFLASVLWLVPRRATLGTVAVWIAAVTSPAVMLGIERGNPDLFLFAVLVVAVAVLRRLAGRYVAVALLLLAAMLKLFPVFALGVLLRQRTRRAIVTFAGAAAAFGAYGIATFDDIRVILEVVPKFVFFSFGAPVGLQALREALGSQDGPLWDVALVLVLAVAFAAAAAYASRRRRLVAPAPGLPSPAGVHALDAYWVGALVYAGSFGVAYNWDYRLMFLLLTIPQLLRWAAEKGAMAPAARLGLASVVATLWLGEVLSGWNPKYPLEELLNLALFAILLAGILLTLPEWLVRRTRLMHAARQHRRRGGPPA